MEQQTDDGAVIVCESNQVEHFSIRGFRLREVIYNDSIQYANESTTTLHDNGYQRNVTMEVNKPFALREPRFVMVQGLDLTLAEQQATIEELRQKVFQASTSERDAVEKATAQEKRTRQLEADNTRLSESLRAEYDGKETLRTSNRKLEGDISKIRVALGDLKMKEILGA